MLKVVAQGIIGENRVKETERRGGVRESGLKKNRTKILKKKSILLKVFLCSYRQTLHILKSVIY